MEIILEAEWENLSDLLITEKGTAILIGATDSGKTSLIKYLLLSSLSKNITTSLVDADVGQSFLGLPGTVCMKVFHNLSDLDNPFFEKMVFIGTLNPAKKNQAIVEAARIMNEFCRRESELTFVDTSGLIAGEAAKALKMGKVRAIKPSHIIAIQHKDEAEHILNMIDDIHITRLKVSKMARVRNRDERVRYRKRKFDEYFSEKRLSEFIIYNKEAGFYHNGRLFKPKISDFPPLTIIGLNHNEMTFALGFITELQEDSVTFMSPVQSIKNINRVVFGDMTKP